MTVIKFVIRAFDIIGSEDGIHKILLSKNNNNEGILKFFKKNTVRA